MNRLRIWLIPGLLVIIALSGLVFFRGRIPQQEQPTPKIPVAVVKVPSKPKGFAKPVEPSLQEKASGDADAMVEALNTGNISDCEKITWNEEMRQQCEDNINYATILNNDDEKQCDELHSEILKTQCYDKIYLNKAIDQRDVSLCEKITAPDLKQMCLDQMQMIVSHSAKSADDCTVIASDALRQQCEDNYYLKSSAKTLNIESCDSISDSYLSNQCKKTVTSNIAAIEQSKQAAKNATDTKELKEVVQLCDSLAGPKSTKCKDAIYPRLAFDEKDLSHCDKVSSESAADECHKEQGDKINEYYLRQSLASRDKDLCNQISDNELKQFCFNS